MSRSASARFVGPTASVFHSSDSKSSIETKVGSPPMVRRTSSAIELLVDLLAESVERLPRFFRKGLGDARMFGDAFDAHVELEIDVGETRHARNRRGVAIVRRRGKRDVTLAGKQTRGRIKADPAGAGKIDLGPGVQIGEVVVRAGRAVESDKIRFELDEIAGHEPRRQPEVSQDLHEKPARSRGTSPKRARTSPPGSAPPPPCG